MTTTINRYEALETKNKLNKVRLFLIYQISLLIIRIIQQITHISVEEYILLPEILTNAGVLIVYLTVYRMLLTVLEKRSEIIDGVIATLSLATIIYFNEIAFIADLASSEYSTNVKAVGGIIFGFLMAINLLIISGTRINDPWDYNSVFLLCLQNIPLSFLLYKDNKYQQEYVEDLNNKNEELNSFEKLLNTLEQGILLFDSSENLLFGNKSINKIFDAKIRENREEVIDRLQGAKNWRLLPVGQKAFRIPAIKNYLRDSKDLQFLLANEYYSSVSKLKDSPDKFFDFLPMRRIDTRKSETNRAGSAHLRRRKEKAKSTKYSEFSIQELYHYEKLGIVLMNGLTEMIDDFGESRKDELLDMPAIIFDANIETPSEDKQILVSFSFKKYQRKTVLSILITDISDREEIVKLVEMDQVRTNINASFSHELRTPTNAIMGMAQCLLHHPDIPADLKNDLILPGLISAKNLVSLINDILDYNQYYLGNLVPQFHQLNIGRFLTQLIEDARVQARMKNIKVKGEIKADLPTVIVSDEARLYQVILNLISNALKFSDRNGEIEIIADISQHEHVEYLMLSVRDSGVGMDYDELRRLERLLKAKKFTEKISINSSGAGLGLTISQILLEVLRSFEGLQFHSVPQQGTTVSFEIPLIKIDTDKNWKEVEKKLLEFETVDFHSKAKLQGQKSMNMNRNTDWKNEMKRTVTISQTKKVTDDSIWKTLRHNTLYPDLYFDERTPYEIPQVTNVLSHRFVAQSKARLSQNTLKSEVSPRKGSAGPVSTSFLAPICSCKDVLIVDDNEFNVLSISSLLKILNVKTMKAFNGQEAIDLVLKLNEEEKCGPECRHIRLILMDLNMPIMGGVEATKKLKEMMREGKISEVPIVACTAYSMPEELEKCHQAGIDDIIEKPVPLDKLKRVLNKFK